MTSARPSVADAGTERRFSEKKEIPKAAREWVFGLRSEVSECVHYLDDARIIYPAGEALVIHSTVTPSQSFVPLSGESCPQALALSQKRDILAICFSGATPTIELWNTDTMNCDKVLTCPEVESKGFISASFSAGNKMLVAQGGPPDWTMALFLVEKGRVFSLLRLTDIQDFASVTSVSFHPTDTGIVSIIGCKILRLMKLHDKLLKSWGFAGGQEHSCASQVWFDDHILLVGTAEATILVLEDGEHQATLNVTHPDFARKKGRADDDSDINNLGFALPWHNEVTAIKNFEGGFLCACGPDKIFLFQKSENIHEFFSQLLEMKACEPSPAARVSERGEHTISCISINSKQSEIVIATQSGQLFKNKFPCLVDLELQTLVFSPVESLNHKGSIVDVDTCIWKPIAVTVGSDKILRTWDIDKHNLLFQYTFKEQIYSIALHPTGLHVAVGLTDALHIYHLLFDIVRHYKEMKIRRCSLCNFSWGGQHLAAVDGNLLVIFSCIFLKRTATLKGHTNKITGVTWLPDDSSLVSCSADGGIFGWDLQTNSVAWEIRVNECQFLSSGMFVVEKEGPTIFSGCPNMIYHLNTGQMVEEGSFSHGSASCITFCPVKTLVIVGTSEGHILIFDFPAIMESEPTKVQSHASAVTKVIATADEDRLISCGADGVVIIWALTTKIEESMRVNQEKISTLPTIPEMLVSEDDIEKMRRNITKLENEVDYLKKEKTHHLSLQERKFQSQVDEMMTTNQSTASALKQKIQKLEEDFKSEKERLETEIDLLKNSHKTSTDNLVQDSRKKLMYEYSKQDKLESKLNDMKDQMQRERQDWEEQSKKELEEQLSQYKATIGNLNHQLQKVTSEMEKERQQDAQLLRLVEASTEVELGHLQNNLYSQLAEERSRTSALREERATLQRIIWNLEKEKENTNVRIRLMKEDKKQLEEEASRLQKSLASLRKEIRHRNEMITQREEELITLRVDMEQKKKLEVLQEYEINRLQNILNPTQEVIQAKTNQIQNLDQELQDVRLQVEARDQQVRHLSQRLTASQGLKSNLQRQLHTTNTRVTRLQNDIASTSKVIHNPKKLKEAFKALAEKHLPKGSPGEIWTRTFLAAEADAEDRALKESLGDQDTFSELLRQRQVLEEALDTLKEKEKKDKLTFKSRISTLIKENRYLLKQVQDLDAKVARLEEEKRSNTTNNNKKTVPYKKPQQISINPFEANPGLE